MKQPSGAESEYKKVQRLFRYAAAISLAVITFGAIFYHFTEKFTWVNSFYFCVVTLATVGYGDITPKTDAGKIFTIFYILIGVGIIATFFNLTVRRAVAKRSLNEK
ncbi:MAG TPA: potassium channel family protein [Candidatus Saccharimonadia bacterium]|nr:potassium channel family protein [Candidatus Saccharimonadia bacterium]